MKNFFKRNSRVLGLLFAVLITITVYIFRDKFIDLKGYGYFGLFLLSVLGNATVFLPVPVILSAFIGGAIFNPILVSLIVSFGATIGELTGYLAGYGAEKTIKKDLKLSKIQKYLGKYGMWTIFFLAAVPNPLFDLAGIVAGATGIPVRKYFIAVWFGKLIKFGVLAYLGSRSIVFLDKFI